MGVLLGSTTAPVIELTKGVSVSVAVRAVLAAGSSWMAGGEVRFANEPSLEVTTGW